MNGFFYESASKVGSISGVSVDLSKRKMLLYRENSLELRLRCETTGYMLWGYNNRRLGASSFDIVVEVPEEIRWEGSAMPIPRRKRQQIIKNIESALLKFSHRGVIVPDDIRIFKEEPNRLLGGPQADEDKLSEAMLNACKPRLCERRQGLLSALIFGVRFNPMLLFDKGVVASGLNKAAYPRPGCTDHLASLGLVPLEDLAQAKELQENLDDINASPFQRAFVWSKLEDQYRHIMSVADLKFYPDPYGIMGPHHAKGVMQALYCGLSRSVNGISIEEIEEETRSYNSRISDGAYTTEDLELLSSYFFYKSKDLGTYIGPELF